MSQVSGRSDNSALPLSLSVIVETLDALEVPLKRQGEELVLKDPRKCLTGELIGAARANKSALLALCDLRTETARLLAYGVRLRCENPPKGTRGAALAYQKGQLAKLAALVEVSGLAALNADGAATGYVDPADPFAETVLDMLRQDLAELYAGPYPVPLPDGCELIPAPNFDAFAAGRLYNGKQH